MNGWHHDRRYYYYVTEDRTSYHRCDHNSLASAEELFTRFVARYNHSMAIYIVYGDEYNEQERMIKWYSCEGGKICEDKRMPAMLLSVLEDDDKQTLPDRSAISHPYFGWVYAAEYDDGVVKVGMSRNPKGRKGTLPIYRNEKHRVVKFFVSPRIANYASAESIAHHELIGLHAKGETVGECYDAPFSYAVSVINNILASDKDRFLVWGT